MRLKIIVVVGPNASGKSELGVKLAKKYNGEIISADSRQIYRGLNIGSGKIKGKWTTIKKRKLFIYKNISHYCIDIANPKKAFTAFDYKRCAEKAIADIISRGKTPIIVGGTGFYIDAALGRIELGGAPPNQKLRRKLLKYTTSELLKYLKKLDPKRAKIVEQNNPRRLMRAIEVAQTNIKPQTKFRSITDLNLVWGKAKIVWLGIKRSPEELKKRIRNRLLHRLQGIIKEVKYLHSSPKNKNLPDKGLSWKRLYDLGLEYRYTSLYLQKKLSKDEFIRQLETAIWHYAKRQMTWFKRNKNIKWIYHPRALSISL